MEAFASELLIWVAGIVLYGTALVTWASIRDGRQSKKQGDISALIRRVAEDQRIKAVLDQVGIESPDPIWFKDIDNDYRMLWFTDSHMLRFGKSREEYYGHTDHDVWPATIADAVAEIERDIQIGKFKRTTEETPAGWQYVCRSAHRTRDGRAVMRGQAVSLADIFEAMAAGQISETEAVEELRRAYRRVRS